LNVGETLRGVTPLIAERLASLVVAHFNVNDSVVFVGRRLTW
jgi:hypothetical protein